MTCKNCEQVKEVENDNMLHVIRKCKTCGREMHVLSPGEHGIGIKIEAGDQFVIPSDWLRIHVNPLKGRGQLSRAPPDY